jgi:nitrogen-specific signal transduction histidine kinase/CheY-like chemotaxis protein
VTDRNQHEQERERLQSQLMQTRKIESIGRLAGGIAHDFNNMLGVILGYAEMALKKSEGNDSVCKDLKEIMRAASRSASMTSQLLAFARKQPIAPNVIDLNQTVDGIKQMLQRLIGEHIDLVWSPVANLWPIRMDRAQVEQILVNLSVNARDAIPGSGCIKIATDKTILTQVECAGKPGLKPGCYIKLTVADNGCGMDSDLLEAVFDPFFTTKEIGKGTGLGLATVYGIVKQNDGYIHLSSAPGKGTEFSIYFPRCEEDIKPENNDEAIDTWQEGDDAGKTILIVEDEPGILRLSEAALKSMGYQTLTATGPSLAIQVAEAHDGKVDLLLTDVVMPEMNGKDLAEAIRRLCPDVRVLYMSGYTDNVISDGGKVGPEINFIQKPFKISQLAHKVEMALQRGDGTASPPTPAPSQADAT